MVFLANLLFLPSSLYAQNSNAVKFSIKDLDSRINSLSTSIQYNCSNDTRKQMCEKVLKSTDRSINILSKMSKNDKAVQAKIDNLKKVREQAVKNRNKQ